MNEGTRPAVSSITTAIDVASASDVFAGLFRQPDSTDFADVPTLRVTAGVDGSAITHCAEMREACTMPMAELVAPLLDRGWAAVLLLQKPVASPNPRIGRHLGARRVREQLAALGVSGEGWGAVVEFGPADRRQLVTTVRLATRDVTAALRLTWGSGGSPLLLVRDQDRLDLASGETAQTLLDAFWPEQADGRQSSVNLSRALQRQVLPSGDALIVGFGSHDDPDRQLLCLNAPPEIARRRVHLLRRSTPYAPSKDDVEDP